MLSGVAESGHAGQQAAATQAATEQGGLITDMSVRLLRFYWFRLSDFAVPAALSLSVTVILAHWIFQTGSTRGNRIGAFSIAFLILGAAGLMIFDRNVDMRPRADQRSLPSYPDDKRRTGDTFRNWKRVCEWVAENTPPDAVFITPAKRQTFKWYAGRTEVVCWKDIPQDASSILNWRDRPDDLYFPQQRFDAGLLSCNDEQLSTLAGRYCADFLLLPQRQVDQAMPPASFEQVYPDPGVKSMYVVLKANSE